MLALRFHTAAREAVFLRPMHPPCFDSRQQFDEWQRLAWETQLNKPFSFCRDCTPDFMAQMLKAERCIRPDTVFRFNTDIELEGWAPLRPTHRARAMLGSMTDWKD